VGRPAAVPIGVFLEGGALLQFRPVRDTFRFRGVLAYSKAPPEHRRRCESSFGGRSRVDRASFVSYTVGGVGVGGGPPPVDQDSVVNRFVQTGALWEDHSNRANASFAGRGAWGVPVGAGPGRGPEHQIRVNGRRIHRRSPAGCSGILSRIRTAGLGVLDRDSPPGWLRLWQRAHWQRGVRANGHRPRSPGVSD